MLIHNVSGHCIPSLDFRQGCGDHILGGFVVHARVTYAKHDVLLGSHILQFFLRSQAVGTREAAVLLDGCHSDPRCEVSSFPYQTDFGGESLTHFSG
jgi:hypothetical protein